MAFSFSNLKANLGEMTGGLKAMPTSAKLMAAGSILKGGQPDWAAILKQYGGHSGLPTATEPQSANVPGKTDPMGDVAARVAADLGKQSGLTTPEEDGQGGFMDDLLSGKYGLLGMLGGGDFMKSPMGLLTTLGGGSKGFGFGSGVGGLMSAKGR